jgi:hypothetical protein
MADRRKAVSSILRFGAGKDTLPALPVIFQIGAGMVGPEWYRAGTSETLYSDQICCLLGDYGYGIIMIIEKSGD